jgi:MFS family permease
MALYGFSLSLPTIVKNMGFTAANAQGLSAPPYIFASVCVVASGFFSDRYRMRACTVAFPSLFAFV